MVEDLLNLVSAIREENWRYSTDVLPYGGDGFDFVLTCSFLGTEERSRTGFDFSLVLPLLESDFEDYCVDSYVYEEGYYEKPEAGVFKHVVEFKVKV